MKNNEIMISVRFEKEPEKYDDMSFIVLKDITLKNFIEAIYYGLRKNQKYEECFELFSNYLKTRKELIVLYTSKGNHSIIDITEVYGEKKTKVYDMPLEKLGFVTSSCLFITKRTQLTVPSLFNVKDSTSFILKDQNNLEYNISTRRLNVVEPSVIDIIPPNEMPKRDKTSIIDIMLPTLLSTGGMLGARYLITKLSPSSVGMGGTMLMMSGAMGVVALVTSTYNFFKKRKDHRGNVKEWKQNYENYIARVIRTIRTWQESDIVYLNTTYPEMNELFENTADISGMIFSRSRNDKDFTACFGCRACKYLL